MQFRYASESRPGTPGEDYAVFTPAVVALFDGAGVPAGAGTGCVHGVRWYVQRLACTLLTEAADGTRALTDALAAAITATSNSHRATCDPAHPLSPSSTVVITRTAGGRLDWLVLGDSTLVLADHGGGVQAICDRRLDEVARPARAALAGRASTRAQHDRWVELVDQERAARNHPGGYWIAADDPAAAAHALTGSHRASDLHSMVLASDGATRPVDQFGLYDWTDLVDMVQRMGPAAWLANVRELELTDPESERWPRTKTHDDATLALASELEPLEEPPPVAPGQA